MSNRCDFCSRDIRFVLMVEETETTKRVWSQPLEAMSRAVRSSPDGVIEVNETFRIHDCPEKTAALQKEWAKGSDLPRRQFDMKELITKAQTRVCETCKADVDQPCMNMTARRQGREVPTVWPHPKRLENTQ